MKNNIDLQKILSDHKLWLVGNVGRRAYLSGTDLSGADLSGTDLSGAYLRRTNLSGANLSRANLSETDLSWANLSEADLRETILDPTAALPEIPDVEIANAGLQIVGDKIYGWRTDHSKVCGNTHYIIRPEPYIAPVFSVDTKTECHPGIYLSGFLWIEENYPNTKIVRCYCLREELVHAGDKWRCKRLWVVEGEVKP